MHLDHTPEQKALRAELRAYFEQLLTPEIRAELARGMGEGGPAYKETVRRMGADGWLGVGWPSEYGGHGRTPIEQFIFFDEAYRAGAPIPLVTLNTVGPTLMLFGSEEQKQAYLPGILRGEVEFAIGYSEPNAGTDLASLRTRAERVGDEYVINGQKVFTSGAHDADYVWLAARTDPDVPKHKGITMFIVPTDAEGFKVTPIYTMAGGRTNATFYEDVRVPASAIVGEENQGWRLITTQLNHERVALSVPGALERRLEDVWRWASEQRSNGRRLVDEPWVQHNLARVRAGVDVLRLFNWRLAWELTEAELNPADASSLKIFGTELAVEGYRLLIEVLGPAGAIRDGSPGAVLHGDIERAFRGAYVNTFGGGVNEIQREIVAVAGLGLPRAPRNPGK